LLQAAAAMAYTESAGNKARPERATAAGEVEKKAATSGRQLQGKLSREGLSIEFFTRPLGGERADGKALAEGQVVEVAFRVTDASSGKPVKGLYPAAWMDVAKAWNSDKGGAMDCKARVGIYLQGTVGLRPLVDLNSYFVMVLNQDATVSVVDPLVGITGITQLFAQIILKRPGADWAKTGDDKRVFISMPRADEVAVVDAEAFKVLHHIEAGEHPARVALQPDEKYLWVGNDSRNADRSGVTIIDIEKRSPVAHIPTGQGHHEIAFSADSRYAFVSNRKDGTVAVIDIGRLRKIKTIKTGPMVISITYSALSDSLYVADAETGGIAVIDGRRHEITARIPIKPGLGPMGVTEDGRWAMAVNSREDAVYVMDASTNRLAHTIPVGKEPYQLGFSRSFAYVRGLGTERVHMINLEELAKGKSPPVVSFPAGSKAPKLAKGFNIADGIKAAPGEAAVLIVSPAENTVYYYMEGMNAPMGNLRNYGHKPRAVEVIDRALRETEPGVYTATVRIPSAGTYDVPMLLDTPRILHCFNVVAKPSPHVRRKGKPVRVKVLSKTAIAASGETFRFRFNLIDTETQKPRSGLKDVRVAFFKSPSSQRIAAAVREVSSGIYEAELPIRAAGAYYVYVAVPSLKLGYGKLPFVTLRATAKQGSDKSMAPAARPRG
jgi:YVTN family beta-propeller protein